MDRNDPRGVGKPREEGEQGKNAKQAKQANPDEHALRERAGALLPQQAEPSLDLDALFAGLEGQLEAERGLAAWLRARPTGVRMGAVAVAVLLLTGAVAISWARPDRDVYPLGRMALSLVLLGGLSGIELVLALRPLQRAPLPAWVAPGALAGALLGLLVLYSLPVAHLEHPASLQAAGTAALLQRALPCFRMGLFIAGGCYALVRMFDRGGAWHALLTAACGGLVANLILQLHCPITAPSHLLLAHGSVALLLLAVTALLARRS